MHAVRTFREKAGLEEEAQQVITSIQQLSASLEDEPRDKAAYSKDLKITYPLRDCIDTLRERLGAVQRLHKERFEQVKSTFCHNCPPPHSTHGNNI